ncbi:4'-phosphopantetheinyl transferase family protein [Tichowtungia aerotolerans]|uniref:4'-phosphopantetheinyl transferase superfamily protein n=1 Tax=Tichowtungia aerotolerans TaxID=2697043 RepID=A0A6P1ME16_9BACT|nr:4'-phosphopantetheinyl transferase superfamily protein [Tichowtungia aerotolerans]QHI70308.1 4'-phosphopantetheinyl transferase superfamily protein [Tichowtungia aerotolerans]
MKKANSITLWSLRIPEHRDQVPACRDILTSSEHERAARFINAADQERYILCRGMLRRTLSEMLSRDPAAIVFNRNALGKPYLPNRELEFNVSHSRDRLLIAIAADRAVGVDIEFRRDGVPMTAIAKRWFAPAEKEFFQGLEDPQTGFFDIWALKEAYVKARGEGIFRELRSFCVPLPYRSGIPAADTDANWGFQSLEIDPHYSAALVWKKRSFDEDPPEVHIQ